jgi:hypothetical protein
MTWPQHRDTQGARTTWLRANRKRSQAAPPPQGSGAGERLRRLVSHLTGSRAPSSSRKARISAVRASKSARVAAPCI